MASKKLCKDRTVRIVRVSNDSGSDNVDSVVRNFVERMQNDGWQVISASTAMTMFPTDRGLLSRIVEWCTTLIFERDPAKKN